MCQQTKELRMSQTSARPETTGIASYWGINQMPFERSNTFDCLSLRTEPIATTTLLRKTQSASDLTKTKVSVIPRAARFIAFLWRRPAQSQDASENPIESIGSGELSPVEDIKQRWRRQQIAIQQKRLPAPEKTSIWRLLTQTK